MAETPVTTPLATSTVATAVLLLAQVPPGVEVVSADVRPSHTCNVPVMFPGSAYTVTMFVTKQVVGIV